MSFSAQVVSLCTARLSSSGYIARIVGAGVVRCCRVSTGQLHPSLRLYVRAIFAGLGDIVMSGIT